MAFIDQVQLSSSPLPSVTKILAAVAVSAFVAGAVTFLPSFAPSAQASIQKADRLQVSQADPACAEQNWPNIDASCLKRVKSNASIKQVRMVTTDKL